MNVDLTGKRILVTGASRGIGAAIAKQLMEAGACVCLHYNREKEAAEAILQGYQKEAAEGILQSSQKQATEAMLEGHERESTEATHEGHQKESTETILQGHQREFTETILQGRQSGSCTTQADLADPISCARLFGEAVAQLGGLDGLVNNAGIATSSPIDASDENWLRDWDLTHAVNLNAAAILSRLAILHFQQHGGGRIVHIASRASFRGDTPEYLAYASSKAGMVALHRSIARGFGKQEIKSFLIAPGFVRTDMAQDFMDQYGESYALDDIALPKLTEPADLGPMVTLLMSGLADHATGCTIDINAGSYVH